MGRVPRIGERVDFWITFSMSPGWWPATVLAVVGEQALLLDGRERFWMPLSRLRDREG